MPEHGSCVSVPDQNRCITHFSSSFFLSLPPGIVTPEVFEWTARFTDDYHKFSMDIHTLNRLLVDEKYLCFVCLQHHANKGYVSCVCLGISL
jgi:hypothetical protein